MKYPFLALVLLALTGAGCTMSQWTLDNGMKVYVNAPGIAENRCDELLKLDEAKTLTGMGYTDREASVSSRNTIFNKTFCEFTIDSATGSRLYIDAYVGSSQEKTYDKFTFWKKSEGVEAIPGLGDEAQLVPGLDTVQVMVDHVVMSFHSQVIDKDGLLKIARIVVPRFDKTEWAKEMRAWKP